MTWGKMDDKFHRNRKVRELRRVRGGREALGVWVFWWSWVLDDPELTGVVPSYELESTEVKAAELLVEHGLWDTVDGGYRFHDFHDYNPTRAQVEAKREADRSRVAGKRGASRADVACDTETTNARVASTRVPTRPDPSRPDPDIALVPSPLAPNDTLSVLYSAFGKAYQTAMKQPVPGNRGSNWDLIAAWFDRVASMRGVSAESLVRAAVESFFEADYARTRGFAPALFAKSYEQHVPPAEQTAAMAPSHPVEAAWHEAEAAAERARVRGLDASVVRPLERAAARALDAWQREKGAA